LSNIFIATSTFAQFSEKPIEMIKANGFNYNINTNGRKLLPNEIVYNLKNCEGVIAGTEKYSSNILDQLLSLKVISRIGVGLDNIDLEATSDKKIKVFKTSTHPALAVVELVMGLMIDINRHITSSNNSLQNGIWRKKMGSLVSGKTLGIIGLGSIGKELVKVSKGFGLNILAFDKIEDKIFAATHKVKFCDLDTLLSKSDIISIHVSLSPETENLIDRDKFSLMKSDAILINTSRGEVIDETALYDALKSNQICAAGLDVFEKEPYSGRLQNLNNLVLTPHIGAYAKEIRMQMEIEATENLIKGLNDT